MNEKQELKDNLRTGAKNTDFTVDHTYGAKKPIDLFVRITVQNCVRNRGEKILDKNA